MPWCGSSKKRQTLEGPIYEAKQTTNEPLIVAKVKELPSNILYNLSWLIPMAMGDTKVYNITEVE